MIQLTLCLSVALAASGCTVVNDSAPGRTAREEMMIATAADRAAQHIAAGLPGGGKVFLDTTNFDATDGKFAIGAVRDQLIRRGDVLVADRAAADSVVELRSAALSIDQAETVWGVPQFTFPLPLSGTLNVPEIAFYGQHLKRGIADFAATEYDAKSGLFIASTGPEFGYSDNRKQTVMIFFSWTKQDFAPSDELN
jgi:hypothetical protein